MKITQSNYKNIFAIRLETEKYVALVLPSEGGKIASFQYKASGKEYLLQNPAEEYLHIGLADDFENGECSGFDDMFPTIDPVTVNGNDYPDHGEICRVPFSYCIMENCLVLQYVSSRLGYFYQKKFSKGINDGLHIEYEIVNQSEKPLNGLWAGHCLVRAERGGQIIVPFEEESPIDCVYDSNKKIENPIRLSYKKGQLNTFWTKKREAQKWYFFEKCEKGMVGYQYPQGDTFVMEFDKNKLPYLGLWIDYGFVNGSHYVGLEPCTLGYDTVENAARYNQVYEIKREEPFKFSIVLYVRGEL